MIQLLGLLILLLVDVISILILWRVLKFLNLHEWLYIPRRSKLAQRIQFGTFFFILPAVYVNIYDFIAISVISPLRYYELMTTMVQDKPTLAGLILILNSLLRNGPALVIWSFGLLAEFLQFWLDNTWVNWVVEQYPIHYKEILLLAYQERKKWRTTHKMLPDFQAWVQDLANQKGWS